MYLWKCWRESRWIFGIALVCVLILFLLTLYAWPKPRITISSAVSSGHGVVQRQTKQVSIKPELTVRNSAGLWFYLQVMPIALLAWFLGGKGVGRNLGEGSGNFLFTRPRSRRRLVWTEWCVGIGELAVIILLVNLVYAEEVYRIRGDLGLATSGQQLLAYTALLCAASVLATGLVYAITYCFTAIVGHARGAIFAGGCLVAYPIIGKILHHFWRGVQFPSLIPHVAHQAGTPLLGIAPWQPQMLVRAALVLACVFLSQEVLQRGDFA